MSHIKQGRPTETDKMHKISSKTKSHYREGNMDTKKLSLAKKVIVSYRRSHHSKLGNTVYVNSTTGQETYPGKIKQNQMDSMFV